MHIYRVAAPIVAAAAGGMGIVAQLPTVEVGGEYTKYGVIGILGLVIFFLLQYTIPRIMDGHEKTVNRIGDELKTGMTDITKAIKDADDRQSTLLQSTIHQLMEQRREDRKP